MSTFTGEKAADEVRLRIYNLDERLQVAQILIKNGYTVSQGKCSRTATGKSVDYYLRVTEDADNADTAR